MSDKAIVRQNVEKLPGVVRTWFEWSSDGDPFKRILVVEVNVETDPNVPGFDPSILENISSDVAHSLTNQTTMQVHGLRIVPKL